MPETLKLEPIHPSAICSEKESQMAPQEAPANTRPQPLAPLADDPAPTPDDSFAPASPPPSEALPTDPPLPSAFAPTAITTPLPTTQAVTAIEAPTIDTPPATTPDVAPDATGVSLGDTPVDETPAAIGDEDVDVTPVRATKPGQVEGIVVALAPNVFEVVVGDTTYLCAIRGRLRKQRTHTPSAPPTGRPGPTTNGRRPGAAPLSARPSFADRRGAGAGPRDRRDQRQRNRTDETAPIVAAEDASAAAEAVRPTRVAPGDRVLVTLLGPGEGVIEDILPRSTTLARMRSEVGSEQIMMANVTLAALVFAVSEPPPNIGLLDRYLALCEHAGVRALICLNKLDLGLSDEAREVIALYEGLGYSVLRVSAATGEGVEDLRERLLGQIALLTGPSGVGKSSLMNRLIPGAGQRTATISEATGKGRHTTTGARLLPLPGGGWLADTAGIRELALWATPADELARSFVELRPIADDCEYEDCAHGPNEEGCAIQAALAEGRIAPSRYASFTRLLAEARADERPAWE